LSRIRSPLTAHRSPLTAHRSPRARIGQSRAGCSASVALWTSWS
jgi:hypothetical protein